MNTLENIMKEIALGKNLPEGKILLNFFMLYYLLILNVYYTEAQAPITEPSEATVARVDDFGELLSAMTALSDNVATAPVNATWDQVAVILDLNEQVGNPKASKKKSVGARPKPSRRSKK